MDSMFKYLMQMSTLNALPGNSSLLRTPVHIPGSTENRNVYVDETDRNRQLMKDLQSRKDSTLLAALDKIFGVGASGGLAGADSQGFRFMLPNGVPYGGVFPGGYQTGIGPKSAWGGKKLAGAKGRLNAHPPPIPGGASINPGQIAALQDGVLGGNNAAFSALDSGATAADRLLQYNTESAQARAGIGGQQLASGMAALRRQKTSPWLSMLQPYFS